MTSKPLPEHPTRTTEENEILVEKPSRKKPVYTQEEDEALLEAIKNHYFQPIKYKDKDGQVQFRFALPWDGVRQEYDIIMRWNLRPTETRPTQGDHPKRSAIALRAHAETLDEYQKLKKAVIEGFRKEYEAGEAMESPQRYRYFTQEEVDRLKKIFASSHGASWDDITARFNDEMKAYIWRQSKGLMSQGHEKALSRSSVRL